MARQSSTAGGTDIANPAVVFFGGLKEPDTKTTTNEYFSHPLVDKKYTEFYYKSVSPAQLSTEDLNFEIPELFEYEMLCLDKFYLKLGLVMTDQKGTRVPNNRLVGVINNLGHSLFKTVELTLGDTKMIDNLDNYHYMAFFINLLNFSRESQDTFLTDCGWSIDNYAHPYDPHSPDEQTQGLLAGSANYGWIARRMPFLQKKKNDDKTRYTLKQSYLFFRIFHPLAFCSLPLFNKYKVRLCLKRNPNTVYMMTNDKTDQYQINIQSCELLVGVGNVWEPIFKSLASKLRDHKGEYKQYYNRIVVQTESIEIGNEEYTMTNFLAQLDKIPSKFYVGIVARDSMDRITSNPFDFRYRWPEASDDPVKPDSYHDGESNSYSGQQRRRPGDSDVDPSPYHDDSDSDFEYRNLTRSRGKGSRKRRAPSSFTSLKSEVTAAAAKAATEAAVETATAAATTAARTAVTLALQRQKKRWREEARRLNEELNRREDAWRRASEAKKRRSEAKRRQLSEARRLEAESRRDNEVMQAALLAAEREKVNLIAAERERDIQEARRQIISQRSANEHAERLLAAERRAKEEAQERLAAERRAKEALEQRAKEKEEEAKRSGYFSWVASRIPSIARRNPEPRQNSGLPSLPQREEAASRIRRSLSNTNDPGAGPSAIGTNRPDRRNPTRATASDPGAGPSGIGANRPGHSNPRRPTASDPGTQSIRAPLAPPSPSPVRSPPCPESPASHQPGEPTFHSWSSFPSSSLPLNSGRASNSDWPPSPASSPSPSPPHYRDLFASAFDLDSTDIDLTEPGPSNVSGNAGDIQPICSQPDEGEVYQDHDHDRRPVDSMEDPLQREEDENAYLSSLSREFPHRSASARRHRRPRPLSSTTNRSSSVDRTNRNSSPSRKRRTRIVPEEPYARASKKNVPVQGAGLESTPEEDSDDDQHFSLKRMTLRCGNEIINPCSSSITDREIILSYHDFCRVEGYPRFQNSTSGIRLSQYRNGLFLKSYDLTTSHVTSQPDILPTVRRGNYSLQLKFNRPIPRALTVVIVKIFPSSVTFNVSKKGVFFTQYA